MPFKPTPSNNAFWRPPLPPGKEIGFVYYDSDQGYSALTSKIDVQRSLEGEDYMDAIDTALDLQEDLVQWKSNKRTDAEIMADLREKGFIPKPESHDYFVARPPDAVLEELRKWKSESKSDKVGFSNNQVTQLRGAEHGLIYDPSGVPGENHEIVWKNPQERDSMRQLVEHEEGRLRAVLKGTNPTLYRQEIASHLRHTFPTVSAVRSLDEGRTAPDTTAGVASQQLSTSATGRQLAPSCPPTYSPGEAYPPYNPSDYQVDGIPSSQVSQSVRYFPPPPSRGHQGVRTSTRPGLFIPPPPPPLRAPINTYLSRGPSNMIGPLTDHRLQPVQPYQPQTYSHQSFLPARPYDPRDFAHAIDQQRHQSQASDFSATPHSTGRNPYHERGL